MAIEKKSLVSGGTKNTGKAVPASKLRNATRATKMTTAVVLRAGKARIFTAAIVR